MFRAGMRNRIKQSKYKTIDDLPDDSFNSIRAKKKKSSQ